MVVFFQTLLFLFLIVLSLFMILIILLQRGKGGGLVGAFGGMGGQSAFGIKSSDVFLRITVVAAIIWFVVCIGGRYLLEMQTQSNLVDEKNVPAAVQTDPNAAPTPDAANPDSNAASATPESSVPVTAEPATDATPVSEPVPANDSAEPAATETETAPNP